MCLGASHNTALSHVIFRTSPNIHDTNYYGKYLTGYSTGRYANMYLMEGGLEVFVVFQHQIQVAWYRFDAFTGDLTSSVLSTSNEEWFNDMSQITYSSTLDAFVF